MKTQYIAKLIDKVLLSSRSDTHLLRLELSQWQSFAYAPGQFISVVLTSDYPPDHPRAGQPHFENKAYTLASRGSGHMLELVLNRAGSFSSRLLDRRVGDRIEFHGPYGSFSLRDRGESALFFAADTGIVPFRAMLQSPLVVPCILIQTAPSAEDLLFAKEFHRKRSLHYIDMVAPSIAQVRQLVSDAVQSSPQISTAYLCGLRNHVSPVRRVLDQLGWSRKQIIAETFD